MYTLANNTFTKGIYLNWWKTTVEVMIYKKPGCIDFENTWVIQLFEADLNLTVGIFLVVALCIIKNEHLHIDQYVKLGVKYQNFAVEKILHYHICHYKYTPMRNFEINKASCFHYIVIGFAFMCVFSVGCTKGSSSDVGTKVISYSSLHENKIWCIGGILYILGGSPNNWTWPRIERISRKPF